MNAMKRPLIGWALSIAVALSSSSLFAGGAAAGGSTAGSNAGTSAGSNAGTNVGSNAGTNVGSNAGTNVGSNAGTSTPGMNNNTNSTTGNTGPIITPVPGQGGVIIGGMGGGVVGSDDVGTAPTTTAPSIPNNPNNNSRPVDYGQHPANGSTPPLTGPITPNHDLTTSNVPPPASDNNSAGVTIAMADRQAQVEGQLVDLFSATLSTTAAARPAAAPATSGNSFPIAPDARTNSASTDIAQPPRVSSHASTDSPLEATATVRKNSTDTFGTYSHPGATTGIPAAPPADAGTVPASGSSASPGGVSVIVGSSPTPPTRTFNNAAITKQLAGGIPAALLSNGQMYVLVCDPRQLSAYAGQNVRINGRLTSSGALVPDRLEVRQTDGNFREITLTKPSEANGTTTTVQDR